MRTQRKASQAKIGAGQHRSHLLYIVCIRLPLNSWVVIRCNACACSGQAPTGRLRSSRSTCSRCKWPHTSPIQSQVTSACILPCVRTRYLHYFYLFLSKVTLTLSKTVAEWVLRVVGLVQQRRLLRLQEQPQQYQRPRQSEASCPPV